MVGGAPPVGFRSSTLLPAGAGACEGEVPTPLPLRLLRALGCGDGRIERVWKRGEVAPNTGTGTGSWLALAIAAAAARPRLGALFLAAALGIAASAGVEGPPTADCSILFCKSSSWD